MNKASVGLKKVLTNKNFVTIILVIVILVILYYGYSKSIKDKTNPINMPVAAKTIAPQTLITNEDVVYKQVPGSMVSENAIRSSSQIIGKYTNIYVTVPQNSIFYSEWLVDGNKLPGNWIEQLDYEKGELGYYMNVSVESTLGNNVVPGSYIDIYMKAEDENGTVMFGKLLKNVKVLVVHDGSGNDIFADPSNVGSPSKIGFAVVPDMYMLLKKADYLNVDLVLAPRGTTVPSEGITVTSSTLRDYIDAQTITVEEDLTSTDTDQNTAGTDTENNG